MDVLTKHVTKALHKKDKRFNVTIAGSYRRGAAFCSDIDVVVQHPLFVDPEEDIDIAKALMQKAVDALTAGGMICNEDRLTLGPKRYSVRGDPPLPPLWLV